VTMAQLREILGSIAQSTALAADGVPSHDSYFSITRYPPDAAHAHAKEEPTR
jgi:hypothetical protein